MKKKEKGKSEKRIKYGKEPVTSVRVCIEGEQT